MNNFIVAAQNRLNFNKMLETQIAQLASSLPHPNGRDFPGQPAVPVKENVKAMITQSGKTIGEPKVKSKKMSPNDPVKEEEKAKVKVEAEPSPGWEEENLVRLRPRTSLIHTCYVPPSSKETYER
jgi:hypothetical protein